MHCIVKGMLKGQRHFIYQRQNRAHISTRAKSLNRWVCDKSNMLFSHYDPFTASTGGMKCLDLTAKIECPGSFPPTMPCTSRVRFTEGGLDRAPGRLRGEEGGRQADGDREYMGTTQESGAEPWHLTTEEDLGGQETAQPWGRTQTATSPATDESTETKS